MGAHSAEASASLRDQDFFTVQDHVVSCELDDGRALLDLEQSAYFSLNPSGASIWQWLEGEGASLGDLIARMVDDFEVEAEHCRNDIISILSSFLEAGFIVKTSDERA